MHNSGMRGHFRSSDHELSAIPISARERRNRRHHAGSAVDVRSAATVIATPESIERAWLISSSLISSYCGVLAQSGAARFGNAPFQHSDATFWLGAFDKTGFLKPPPHGVRWGGGVKPRHRVVIREPLQVCSCQGCQFHRDCSDVCAAFAPRSPFHDSAKAMMSCGTGRLAAFDTWSCVLTVRKISRACAATASARFA